MGTTFGEIARRLNEMAQIGRRRAALEARRKLVDEKITQGDWRENVFQENNHLQQRIRELSEQLDVLRQWWETPPPDGRQT